MVDDVFPFLTISHLMTSRDSTIQNLKKKTTANIKIKKYIYFKQSAQVITQNACRINDMLQAIFISQ